MLTLNGVYSKFQFCNPSFKNGVIYKDLLLVPWPKKR